MISMTRPYFILWNYSVSIYSFTPYVYRFSKISILKWIYPSLNRYLFTLPLKDFLDALKDDLLDVGDRINLRGSEILHCNPSLDWVAFKGEWSWFEFRSCSTGPIVSKEFSSLFLHWNVKYIRNVLICDLSAILPNQSFDFSWFM